jgi:hypothetical protein
MRMLPPAICGCGIEAPVYAYSLKTGSDACRERKNANEECPVKCKTGIIAAGNDIGQ